MNVEIGAEAALFPEKEYISGISVAVRDHYLTFASFPTPIFLVSNYLQMKIVMAASLERAESAACI
jgi:hypothetical protein